jgi:hypothetical protein
MDTVRVCSILDRPLGIVILRAAGDDALFAA